MDVAPNTIVVYSDLACPWAHVSVARLLSTRRRLGLDGRVTLDHRAFPLEVINERPTPFTTLMAEIPVTGALEPEAGWKIWDAPPTEWPVTTLLALEAVQAAKEQGLAVSERFDRALRVAFFAESRCISMRHVILDVARHVEGLDVPALEDALDTGRARHAVVTQRRRAQDGDEVSGSPHLFLPDGSNVHNAGIEMHMRGDHDTGFPIVDRDDPTIYERLLQTAAGATAGSAR